MRDLLRRRMLLVQQKTSHVLSFQSLIARQKGEHISSNRIQQLWPEEVKQFFEDERLVLMGQTNISTIRFLGQQISRIEKAVLKEAKLKPEYEKLLTVDGIGRLLARLNPHVRKHARSVYQRWKADPWHPSLQFKPIHQSLPIYSVRIGMHWRAIGVRNDDKIVWFWIGSHEEYNDKIKSLRRQA